MMRHHIFYLFKKYIVTITYHNDIGRQYFKPNDIITMWC
jgi:hypothetical protein